MASEAAKRLDEAHKAYRAAIGHRAKGDACEQLRAVVSQVKAGSL